MHEVLVNRLGGLSLPRKSVVRITDRPDMTLDVYRGRKTMQQYNMQLSLRTGTQTMLYLNSHWYQNINYTISTPVSPRQPWRQRTTNATEINKQS